MPDSSPLVQPASPSASALGRMTMDGIWLVFGVRHQQAGVALREQFSFTQVEAKKALATLINNHSLDEVVILSTCNRTELYVATTNPIEALATLQQYLLQAKGIGPVHYQDAVFTLSGMEVAQHLFKVTSGLDSLIIGEGQITAQVKEALALAQAQETCGFYLDKLFKMALNTGKRIRTETGLSERNTSVSLVAFTFLQSNNPNLLNQPIAVLGGGKMAEKMMACLQQAISPSLRHNVTIVNRSPNRLNELSATYGFKGVLWEALPQVLSDHPVLFVATGAPHWVLGVEDFTPNLLEQYKQTPLTILDISMPRNVDPLVGQLPGVTLFNIDDLGQTSPASALMLQQAEFEQCRILQLADTLINEALTDLRQWQVSLPTLSTLTQWRTKIEQLRLQELQKVQGMLSETAFAAFEAMSRALVNKILHEPSVRLKNAPSPSHSNDYAKALGYLFDLDEASTDAQSVVSSPTVASSISVSPVTSVSAANTMRLLQWMPADSLTDVANDGQCPVNQTSLL
jgi:glutamyl-tRNA reductase